MLSASLPLCIALVACAHNPEPRAGADSSPADGAVASSDDATAQLVELTGRVVNSGTEQFSITTLQIENAPPTRLVGDLRDELRTLAGAEVKVRGLVDSAGPGRSLRVREYEVLSINGQRPLVGTLLVRDSGIWLAARDTMRLVPELAALRERTGAKIWVVGTSDPDGTSLRVESYGVIAPAP